MPCASTRFVITSVAAFVIAERIAGAQPWAFTRVADSATLVPGSSVPFTVFELPSIEGGVVAFPGYAATTSGPAGVYTGAGGALTTIADRNTMLPGGGGNFTGFGLGTSTWPSQSGGAVAFHGAEQGSLVPTGIYLREAGQLHKIADFQTPVPNGTGGNFFPFGRPSLENGRVVFQAAEFPAGGQNGIYSWQSGALSIIADKSTPIPGGPGTFTHFFEASLDGGQVMFQGNGAGGYNGLFLADQSGAIIRLYDTNTPIPGATGSFSVLSLSAFSAGRVVFYGQGSMAGVYSDVSGQLEVIANHNTPVPGFPGLTFSGFGYSAIDDGVVAFTGLAPGAFLGVFSTHGGSLGKVLANGDLLDGRIVEDCGIGGQSLDGDSLAILVYFTNGTQGIYMATIPAPGALVLLAFAAAAVGRRRRW